MQQHLQTIAKLTGNAT